MSLISYLQESKDEEEAKDLDDDNYPDGDVLPVEKRICDG